MGETALGDRRRRSEPAGARLEAPNPALAALGGPGKPTGRAAPSPHGAPSGALTGRLRGVSPGHLPQARLSRSRGLSFPGGPRPPGVQL